MQFYAGWAATHDSDFARPRGYAVPVEAAAVYRANANPEAGLVLRHRVGGRSDVGTAALDELVRVAARAACRTRNGPNSTANQLA
ncbi:MAG: hypothetical protein OXI95_17780 [bacterium]|nr:hypothetical protein [bacterium]